ncbi:oligosaccharide flippase family protein [Bacillus sp. DX4.1]|uniref:lipopolysaccharide biosynthesis protein n=1 Tax=Bacillus sp. DX4.1 TaxID=3055867 RepID=UPI00259FEAFF|nr:oligosaccharide flippase family protein [Bacillus sp. DX4.1]MDM5190880.1 oligosaccharide flippase family protein [Bacillus sp. DX4.1]
MYKVLKNRLAKRKFLSSLFMILSGAILGQIIIFASSFIIARIYNPNDFGLAGIYGSLLSFVLVIASLRYESAITIAKNDDDALHLVVLSFIIVCLISFATFISVFLLKDIIVHLDKVNAIANFLWVLPLSIFFMGVYQVLNYWAIRKKSFRTIAKTKVNQSIGQVTSYVILGIKFNSPIGLIVGDIIGKGSGIRTLIKSTLKDVNILTTISAQGLWKVLKRYKKFPLISSWSAVINIAALQIPPIIMIAMYNQSIIGWFALSQKVIMAPLGILGQSVAQVYLGQLSSDIRSKKKGLEKFFLRLVKKLFIFGLIPFLGILLLGPWIFKVGFGEQWIESGVYSQCLAPMYIAYFIAFPLSQTLTVLELQKHQLIWDTSRFIGVIVIFFAAKALFWDPKLTLLCYGVFMALSYIVLLILIYFKLKKLDNTLNT